MNTVITLLESLGLHLVWWARALVAWRDPRAPMGLRRCLVLLLGMPLFLLVQGIHTACLLLDEILFPRYRRMRINQALFITGIPRSGTTFLHRTLATDTDRYTTLTTWEALLAPSILQRRLVHTLAWIDGRLGGLGRRGLTALTRRLTGGLSAVHEVGLQAAEEDYLTLLPAGGCFIMLLAFPGAPGLQALGNLDRRMAPGRRRRLLCFYERCLQRHVYVDGGRRILLSKNAAFGSWVGGLRSQLPSARFLVCTREPRGALSSQISAVASARILFGTAVDSEAFQSLFLDVFADTLAYLADTLGEWPTEEAAVIDMADLRAEPERVIGAALARLGLSPGPALASHLATLPRAGHSGHRHDVNALALAPATLDEQLLPPYHRLLALPHRVRTDS